MTVFYAAGLPALISTGITFIYFFLKACGYLFHAISHQTEGRVATAMSGCGKYQHSPDTGEESNTEICEQISGHFKDQHGGGTQRSPGSIPLPRRRQNLCLPTCGDVAEYPEEPLVRQDEKRLPGRRYRNTKNNYGTEPSDSCINSTGVLEKRGVRQNASNEQPSDDETISRKCDRE